MIRTRTRARRGAIAVVAAFCLVPMIGVMALAIDAGLLMAERRRAQVAADAAAYAAVRTYHETEREASSGDPMAAASAAALAYAAACGFSGDGASSTVTTARDPGPGPSVRHGGKTPDLAITVTVASRPPRLFSAIWSGDAVDVVGRATAARIRTAPASIVVLSPQDQGSLSVAGSAKIVVPGEVQVKSGAARAVDVNNMGYVETPKLKVAGGFQTSSGGSIKDVSTTVAAGTDPATIVDPLEAKIVDPSSSGLTTRTAPSGWSPTNPFPVYPGLYNNGLALNSGGMNYTMAPGLYYIKSGDFVVSNGVRVTGSGVTVYLYDGNVSIQGGQGTTITAPTSGDHEDVVIFQRAPKNAVGLYAPHTVNIANGTNNLVRGTIYAPGASMILAGGSTTVDSSQLIVNKLNLSNNAQYRPNPRISGSQALFYLSR